MTQSHDFGEVLKTAPAIVAPNLGEIVSGTVIVSNQKSILVNINDQFTGIISGSHMYSSTGEGKNLSPGDVVEAIVIGDDRQSGLVVLSLRRASQMKLIEKLHTNFDSKEIITVIPNEANKGGLLIDLDGIKGFIPVSQLTPMNYPRVEGADPEKILEHLRKLIGKPFRVRVINVDPSGKKIIFSEKAALEEERSKALSTIKVGDVVDGSISGILTYGLFVTFNGVEGLVHVSEIDWGHVANPSKFAKVGDKVKVKVIGVETDKISLSMKQLKANPWAELSDKFKVGDIIEAPVMRTSQFGVFLSLDGGISGLIHLSEVTYKPYEHIDEVVRAGDTVRAKIISFDPQSKRIGLSMKVLETPPEGYVAPAENTESKPAKKPRKKAAEAPAAE
jgi:small subunit ribosomal protein S1